MAIDLPEAFPTIFRSFKKNSLKKFRKQNSRQSVKDNKPSENEKKLIVRKKKQSVYNNKNFENNNEDVGADEEEQSSLLDADLDTTNLRLTSTCDNSWYLQYGDSGGDTDDWCEQFTKRKKSIRRDDRRYFQKSKDDETLLGRSDEDPEKTKTILKWQICGMTFLSLAIVILATDPLTFILNNQLSFKENSYIYGLWKAPPVKVYIRSYIFNVTNPIEFLQGKEKLRLEELGPYVYTEELEHHNVTFHDNGTVTYHPSRKVQPALELSVGDPKDMDIIVPNIAMLGISSMVADSSMFTNLALLTLLKVTGSQPFLNMTVHDFLWGYNDPLIKVANTVISSWIPFAKLGLLDRMYDDGDNAVTMRLSDNELNDTDRGYLPQYSIDVYNGSPGLPTWGYSPDLYKNRSEPIRPKPEERCQFIRGATEGVIFPQHMSKNVTWQVFRKAFCRIIPIVFDREGYTESGLHGYWYKLPDNIFDSPEDNPEQACYCDPKVKKCLPKGLSDIQPCYYNIPTAVSYPHFYNGDPKLLADIDGLKPDKDKHSTTVILQPELGVAMQVRTRIQTNLVMKKTRYISKLKPFNELIIPLFWVEMSMDELPADIKWLLNMVSFVLPTIQTVIMVLLFIGGCYVIIFHSIRYWLFFHKSSNKYSAVKLTPLTKTTQIVSNISRRGSMALASRKNSLASIRRNSTMLPV